jgi:hypothetical protein
LKRVNKFKPKIILKYYIAEMGEKKQKKRK